MTEPKTTMGMPLVKIKGKSYNVGRAVMFWLGVILSFQTFIWGPYDDKVFFFGKLVFCMMCLNPALLGKLAAAWKSRNGS